MNLIPDQQFLKSLSQARIKVVWLDTVHSGTIELLAGDEKFSAQPSGSGSWQVSEFVLENINFERITLKAQGADIILHMVEIERI